MNRSLKFGLTGALILAGIWFAARSYQTQPTGQPVPAERPSGMTGELRTGDAARPASEASDGLLPAVEMKEARFEVDYAALARSRENPPFEFKGGAGTGRVVDQKGHVILESNKDFGIFGVSVGPDKQHVLVEGGDAKNFVLNPATGLKVQLPVYPPGANMLGMGSWHWIGKTKLLGESGVQAFNASGAPVNCCEGHNVAETRLYVYDVTTRKLAGVTMPGKVTQPVVNVAEVSPDGHVHLVHEVPHAGTQQDLGWYKIDIEQ